MDYRYFGTTGMRVSAIGLGCNPFGNEVDPAGAEQIVNQALDLGVTYFDTADSYFEGRSEDYLGRALHGKRDRAIVATKAGNATGSGPNDTGASRKHLMEAAEASLRRLQTDYIDVYQIHSPDRHTPVEETMRALDDLVRQGKVRYIGCSNYFEWEACEAIWTSREHHLATFVSCQEMYNLLYRDVEKRMVPFCQKYGLALIPYFPLAGAMLSGTYQRAVTPPAGSRGAIRPSFKRWDSERNWAVQEQLAAFAERRGCSLPELAVAWLLTRPMLCTVIAGADRAAHIAANVKALDLHLSEQDLEEIDAITLVDEDRTIAPVLTASRQARGAR
jgi:aryl-alcohol dehydrogenase-like predicted oxidoreductase